MSVFRHWFDAFAQENLVNRVSFTKLTAWHSDVLIGDGHYHPCASVNCGVSYFYQVEGCQVPSSWLVYSKRRNLVWTDLPSVTSIPSASFGAWFERITFESDKATWLLLLSSRSVRFQLWLVCWPVSKSLAPLLSRCPHHCSLNYLNFALFQVSRPPLAVQLSIVSQSDTLY